MMSKNLFVRLAIEDMKRRIWIPVLLILTFLLALPVSCALRLEDYSDITSYPLLQSKMINMLGPYNIFIVFVTMISAIIIGLAGFFYLQSRKKVDFYHSIPVKRDTIFAVAYLNGLMIYLISYLLSLLLCFLILGLQNALGLEVITAALTALAINLIYFSLIYTITIIAVLLTGNLLVSCFITVIFLFYLPVVAEIKNTYYTMFFHTYYSNSNLMDRSAHLSPFLSYIKVRNAYEYGGEYFRDTSIAFFIVIILIVISVLLYRKRPLEAANSALVFKVTKPVLKLLLVIPTALGGGIIIREIASGHKDEWFIFGLSLLLILSYMLIQTIYEFDIRSAFHHKKHLLLCAILSGAMACIFRFDLFQFDNYIPEKDKIESMGVSISGIDQKLYFTEVSADRSIFNSIDFQLENMRLHDISSAYELAEAGIQSTYNYCGEDYERDNEGVFTYTVNYVLKSGSKVYRKYRIERKEGLNLVKNIFENLDYKKAHYPLLQWKEEDINEIYVRYASNLLDYTAAYDYKWNDKANFNAEINGSELKQLVSVYKEELSKLSWEEASLSNPIAEFVFRIGDRGGSDGYYVYPSFKKTIAFLNEKGFDTDKAIDIKNVQEITISNYVTEYNYKLQAVAAAGIPQPTMNYTSENELKTILPELIDIEFYNNNNMIIEVDKRISATVKYKINASDNAMQYSFYFKANKIPDFIKKDLGWED